MKQIRIYFFIVQVIDLLLASIAFFHVFIFQAHKHSQFFMQTQGWVLPLIMIFSNIIFNLFHMYEFEKNNFFLKPAYYVIPATIITALTTSATMYFLKNPISRSFMFFLFSYFGFLVFIERLVISAVYRWYRSRELNRNETLVIVGTNTLSAQFLKSIEENPKFHYEILGFISFTKVNPGEQFEGKPILGEIRDLEKILRSKPVDELVFCIIPGFDGRLNEYFLTAEEIGVTIRIISDCANFFLNRAQFDEFFGIPVITYQKTPNKVVELFIKRCLDICLSLVGLIILFPVFVTIAILIKITMPGPIFFVQERVGLNKRRFKFYKFRTMVPNAEMMKEKLLSLNEMDGPVFKITNDPRVTPLGRFLRKYSLDELPQLWNVLRGDMSLVGPRPPTPDEVEKYERWQLRRLSMRPGITCIWQVSGRNKINFFDWMKMDLYYVDNWSLWLDFKILFQTIPAVLSGHGAS